MDMTILGQWCHPGDPTPLFLVALIRLVIHWKGSKGGNRWHFYFILVGQWVLGIMIDMNLADMFDDGCTSWGFFYYLSKTVSEILFKCYCYEGFLIVS